MEQSELINAPKKGHRILGIDVARSLAILFMVIENYRNAMEALGTEPIWLYWFFKFIEGHAAPGFVTLMGMGLILLTQKAMESGDPALRREKTLIILKRGLFILVLGVFNYKIWPGDILHFYGFYMALCVLFLFRPSWTMLVGAAIVMILTYAIAPFVDLKAGWENGHIWYTDYYTISGFIRNTFFNGYHPIFPWTAYALCGMWLARQPIFDRESRRRYLIIFIPVALLFKIIMTHPDLARVLNGEMGEVEGIWAILLTISYPIHMVLRTVMAIAVILTCLELADRFRNSRIINTLATMGRHSLTHYLAHTLLVLGPMFLCGVLQQNLVTSFIISFAFFGCAVTFSIFWSRRFKLGPLEWVMRKITG